MLDKGVDDFFWACGWIVVNVNAAEGETSQSVEREREREFLFEHIPLSDQKTYPNVSLRD